MAEAFVEFAHFGGFKLVGPAGAPQVEIEVGFTDGQVAKTVDTVPGIAEELLEIVPGQVPCRLEYPETRDLYDSFLFCVHFVPPG